MRETLPDDTGIPGGGSDSSRPDITVIVSAFKRQEYLATALESIAAQTFAKDRFEIILLTDFDPEPFIPREVLGITRRLRTRIFRMGYNLARGLSNANAKVICFLDDDDTWVPTRLARVWSKFSDIPDLIYYQNCQVLMSEDGTMIESSLRRLIHPEGRRRNDALHVRDDEKLRLLRRMKSIGADFNLSSVAVRGRSLTRYLKVLSELRSIPDTFLFYCALASKGSIYLDDSPQTMYRIHGHKAVGPADSERGSETSYKISRYSLWSQDIHRSVSMVRTAGMNELARALDSDTFVPDFWAEISVTKTGGRARLVSLMGSIVNGKAGFLGPIELLTYGVLGTISLLSPRAGRRISIVLSRVMQ
jgi:glycosyltransferase involved in cell wall biosynthesis